MMIIHKDGNFDVHTVKLTCPLCECVFSLGPVDDAIICESVQYMVPNPWNWPTDLPKDESPNQKVFAIRTECPQCGCATSHTFTKEDIDYDKT